MSHKIQLEKNITQNTTGEKYLTVPDERKNVTQYTTREKCHTKHKEVKTSQNTTREKYHTNHN